MPGIAIDVAATDHYPPIPKGSKPTSNGSELFLVGSGCILFATRSGTPDVANQKLVFVINTQLGDSSAFGFCVCSSALSTLFLAACVHLSFRSRASRLPRRAKN